MHRAVVVRAALAASALLTLAGCGGGGPSDSEVQAFQSLALERQAGYVTPGQCVPVTVQQYVLGVCGKAGAEEILTGAFRDAETREIIASTDPTAHNLIATFEVHEPARGSLVGDVEVNLGVVRGDFDPADAMRGAGDVVIFLTREASTGEWVLADGLYAVAQVDGTGRLSMPFVPSGSRSAYLTGVIDVADVLALVVASQYDPVQNGGNGGITDSQQDLIDKANEIANNGGG